MRRLYTDVFTVVNMNVLNIVGGDVTDMLGKMDIPYVSFR